MSYLSLSDDSKPSDLLRFVELDPFPKKWEKLGLGDVDLQMLQVLIMSSADRSPVIQGTGGLRKIRFAREGSNRGKRDSFRICYSYFPDYGIVLLITVFGKNEKSNLSDGDRKVISQVIKMIQTQLDQGVIR